MSTPTPPSSPLSTPDGWNAVAGGYEAVLLPQFATFAARALELARLPDAADVLDVACGPGTLALMAAERAGRVVAVDFAEEMIRLLEQRIATAGVRNVEVIHADGQSLPLDDASFDAAFSMFGLMFFPDRARGFSELHRVLRRGGRAVVSSWTPMENVPVLAATFEAVGNAVGGMPPAGPMPLSNPEAIRTEMTDAGFADVEVHTVSSTTSNPSITSYWQLNLRSSARLAVLRRTLGEERWPDVSAAVLSSLQERFGDDPIEIEWVAYLGVGVRR